jgi:peptide/nickel transport system substrate-binding protein/oligopeptide transport system substrate-binding protein
MAKIKAHEPIGMFRLSYVLDYPVIENYLQSLFAAHGAANLSGYSNPRFDSLLAAGDRARTPQEALISYQQAEDLLVQDMPAIPLVYSVAYLGHSTRVAHVEVDAFRQVRLLELTPAAN